MRNAILVRAAVVLTMAFGCASVLVAQAPSGTKSFDPKTTNTDAAITLTVVRKQGLEPLPSLPAAAPHK